MQKWVKVQRKASGEQATGQLTTERSESSYGQPVLLVDGEIQNYADWELLPGNTQAEKYWPPNWPKDD